MKLPSNIDCENNSDICDYFISKECPKTCNYYFDVMGLGGGAMDIETAKRLEKMITISPEEQTKRLREL
jgi:hypothetical protein